MLKALILLITLCAIPIYAQKVRGNYSPRSNTKFRLSVEIPIEGSYVLSHSQSMTNWEVFTNFNTLPATNYFDYNFTNGNSFYRLQRMAVLPVISQHPQSSTNYSGPEVTLSGDATGSWPLRLQWYKEGAPNPIIIPGATNKTLKLNGTAANAGNYYLMASNSWGIALSSKATVQITSPVPNTVSGKKIHFVVQGGSYDLECRTDGSYWITGGVTDTGYWAYAKSNEVIGLIQLSASFLYPNGALFTLTFETPTGGKFVLTAAGVSGSQTGTFTFTN
jgi:hypothetical protein